MNDNSTVEELLTRMLEPDNDIIKRASIELKEAMKRPTISATLLHLGKFSSSVQVRQYAFVLLRKRFSKDMNWQKTPVDMRLKVKHGLLETITQEKDKTLWKSVTQVVGVIAAHELPDGKWPELLSFLQQLCNSGAQERELGFHALSIVADNAGEELKPYLKAFVSGFHAALQDPSTQQAYYTVITLANIVPFMGSEEATMLQPLIPKIIAVIRKLVTVDEDKALAAMDIFEELLESEVSVLAPHLKNVTEISLEIAANKNLNDSTRVKGLHFISLLARLKKKALIKNKLIAPILNVLFTLMSSPDEDDEDSDDEEEEVESLKPGTVAAQTLNEMALHLPPDKLVSPLLQWAEPAFKSDNIHAQKAAYLAFAVVAEGCAEHIRTKYLPGFVQCVCAGIKHPQAAVRNVALYAVGQFSEHLQPDINKYANDILPVLFEYLSATCATLASGQKVPRSVDRVFYALEMFCETMEKKLLPFVPALMEHFFAALNRNYPAHVRELGLSAIGATANAVEKGIVPFFGQIMEHLKLYLVGEQTEENAQLQVQALDTLGVLVRTVGEETFAPLAQECLQFSVNMVENKNDPDLRKCAYGVFASLSTVMHDGIAPALPKLVDMLITAVESTEGTTVHYNEDEDEAAFPGTDDINDDDEDDDDVSPMDKDDDDNTDDDFAGVSVENAYLEEKEEACLALRELAANSSGAFLPFMEQCSGPVFKLVDYGHEAIRRASIAALSQFAICLGKNNNLEGCAEALRRLVPKLSEVVHTDMERDVVMGALEALAEVLKELKNIVIQPEGHLDAILNCIRNVLSKNTKCQSTEEADEADSEDEDEEGIDSEGNEKVAEYAGDVLPALGGAMTPQEFAPYFAGLLPLILNKTKKHCTEAERSFSVGLLAVCMEPLDGALGPFVSHLLPVYTALARDKDSEVRNNAIFGLGELVFRGRELLFPHYPQILQTLSMAISREDNPLTLDNICAAISRLIIVNISAVPMDNVFPVLLKHLPLREDFLENSMILKLFLFLYGAGHPLVETNLAQILNIVVTMATEQEPQPEQKMHIVELLKGASTNFPAVYNNVIGSLKAETQEKLQHVLT